MQRAVFKQAHVNERLSLTVGLRWMHISNGQGLGAHNPSYEGARLPAPAAAPAPAPAKSAPLGQQRQRSRGGDAEAAFEFAGEVGGAFEADLDGDLAHA